MTVPFDPVDRSNAAAGSSFVRGFAHRLGVAALATAVVAAPLQAPSAAMIGTDALAAASALSMATAAARVQIATFLARDDVRTQMQALGVDADDAAARVAALSDAEVERLGGRLADLPAGGLPHAVTVLLVVGTVLLLADILCFTNFFKLNACVLR